MFSTHMSKLTARTIRTIPLLMEAFASGKFILVIAVGLLLNLVVAMGKRAIGTETTLVG